MPFPNSSFARTGRFTDIRPLNRGASGQVYYAKDNLGREVAVKEALPSHQAFQNIREKFEKESRIQASLQHPNIVSIYHLEEDPQTHELYLICEYANGGSLSDELQGHHDHKLTEPEAIKVARDMCAALEETWHHQIVHRDVKPSNILLTKDSQGNIITAKLGDFGIAQDQKMRRTTVLPGTSLPGTPLYAAPEQNDPKNILDVQADIYALGITLWEMLTGVDYKPLLAQTKVPNLRAYNSQTSDGIAEVIRRDVHDDLTQRYQTPQNMAIDLEDVLKRGHLTAHLTQRVSSTNVPTLRVMPPPPIARISRGGLASLILA